MNTRGALEIGNRCAIAKPQSGSRRQLMRCEADKGGKRIPLERIDPMRGLLLRGRIADFRQLIGKCIVFAHHNRPIERVPHARASGCPHSPAQVGGSNQLPERAGSVTHVHRCMLGD